MKPPDGKERRKTGTEGFKAVGEIEPDELVLAHDFKTGRWVPRRVLARHDSLYNGPLVTVTTDGGPIRATVYHPFWVIRGRDLDERDTPRELADDEDQGLSLDGRWVNSHELRAGDVLIGRDGSQRTVLRIEQEPRELFPVSNLTIENDHTFAVGPDAILVHNTAGCPPDVAPRGTAPAKIHKNSRAYQGDSHVYVIKAPDGSVHKVGKSSTGTRIKDGASKRAESQVRKLNREDIASGGSGGYRSQIRKDGFKSSGEALDYEKRWRDTYRRLFGQDKLPGNREYLRGGGGS